ncbi:MAG: EVE domain-containing protein [Nitrososphaerales archaeon]
MEKLAHPVTLDAIKKDKRFKDFLLVKISRLSVMPVSGEQWKALNFLAKG